ncbi:MAG: c-type cytochrome [Desulfobacterales bacterium]|nr:MAG: c-type cytochrome [Desulfobacterales bacterium]
MIKKIMLGALIMLLAVGVGLAATLTPMEQLGKALYQDENLSLNRNQSCKTCHHPGAGFADPENRRDPVAFPVSDGTDPELSGGANAPTAAYAGFSPRLDYVQDPDTGEYLWIGGMFWNGRATGWTLDDDPLAEQAQGPFLNPREMAMDSKLAVVDEVERSKYARLFKKVFGQDAFNDIDIAYDKMARAIAAFERSQAVTRFNSRFDQFFWACEAAGIDVSTIVVGTDLSALPQGILTIGQLKGLALFNDAPLALGGNGGGNCAACHSTTTERDPQGNALYPPLFTDFSYDNLGIPTNLRLYELLNQKTPPDGGSPPDLGLGGFLASVDLEAQFPADQGYPPIDPAAENGKFKVPTLRNVAKTPPYGHNGFFASLTDIVNFYNKRDVDNIWGEAEYRDTMNDTELGDLGLSPQEVRLIVAFLHSLNDR